MHVTFEQVSFSYADRSQVKKQKYVIPWALKDISFSIDDGTFLGIAGPTGSGKSTLIQHLNGLVHPTCGRVLIDDADLADKATSRAIRKRVGMVFQYPEQQLFAATVYDEIAFGPKNFGCTEPQLETRVKEALSAVHLDYEKVRDKSPFDLSGGQQRRVALAGVLAQDPEMLVLDEPTAGLDPRAHDEFLVLIDELHRQGHSIVMVSHVMDDLSNLADYILVLNDGRLFAYGAPSEVLADARSLESIGLNAPEPQMLATQLKSCGFNLEKTFYTQDALADELVFCLTDQSANS